MKQDAFKHSFTLKYDKGAKNVCLTCLTLTDFFGTVYKREGVLMESVKKEVSSKLEIQYTESGPHNAGTPQNAGF